jgi:hypothetical protein
LSLFKKGFENSNFYKVPKKLNLNPRIYYSTNPSKPGYVHYVNADVLKVRILAENKGKSGIYSPALTNLVNNKRYIGSFVNLKRRRY